MQHGKIGGKRKHWDEFMKNKQKSDLFILVEF
jgi:hypothetical protein